jgi:hypothetical protein
MLGSEILEVAIGVIFVLLLVSLAATAVREAVEGWRRSRAAYLDYAIRELLQDRRGIGLAHSLYQHPLVHGLYSGDYPGPLSVGRPAILARGGELPSYIPSRSFALALMDLAARGEDLEAGAPAMGLAPLSAASIEANLPKVGSPAVQRMMRIALDQSRGDLDALREILQNWYDTAMDRVSGLYRRSTQWILLWIGLAMALALNVDILNIARYLYRDDAARAALVARAGTAATDPAFLQRQYGEVRRDLEALDLPVGWSDVHLVLPWRARPVSHGAGLPATMEAPGWWTPVFSPLLGWFLTALATTLGAPFWFDLLNKVMVVRATVKPHEKSPEEASEDRQLPAPREAVVVAKEETRSVAVAPPVDRAAPLRTDAAPPDGIPEAPHEATVDGCDVAVTVPTPDEALPAATGGVA